MARFAKSIGGFPENVRAMTLLVDGEKSYLQRLRQLKVVPARMRGLSLEPLLGRIDPRDLDLAGIDWVIVGGESGNDTAPVQPRVGAGHPRHLTYTSNSRGR